ncbi:hypothetical protein CEY16_01085 [Halalkalibacillus sediminis]|uniref:N-acetylmuramoyl-L-alanine amidase n=1 Tax=Halalkalibacillus sediminis TaxID=2018042 RepID=A0A2I0QVK9_9BACI|nr:N-acetylmuramoyl-L-alanine amidase [Halalkalibacillus sediminis]PKR78381.1 hypothetical protein CEY16_01085 [Halalkalibacillus sediminis]
MRQWIQDAGHGGIDPGAVVHGQQEKEWNLEASIYVNERLKELGYHSTLTRGSDKSLSNQQRTTITKRYPKGISHHFNAGGGKGAEFIHSIHSDGKFEKLLEEEFKKAGYPFRRTFSKRYAEHSNKDYYFMHRETGACRVTIVEYDFLDGPNRNKLKSESYRKGMYECVVRAVVREEKGSFNIPYVEENVDTFYRVITGSFREQKHAQKRIDQLKKVGFDSFIDVLKK